MPELWDQLHKVHKTLHRPDRKWTFMPLHIWTRFVKRRVKKVWQPYWQRVERIQADQGKETPNFATQEGTRPSRTCHCRNPDKKRGRNAQIMDECDDLAKEERLYTRSCGEWRLTRKNTRNLLTTISMVLPIFPKQIATERKAPPSSLSLPWRQQQVQEQQ